MQWYILKKLNTSTSWGGGATLNKELIFLDLTPIQIHNRALNVVGMYFKKNIWLQAQVVFYTTAENRQQWLDF
jgi:hypothetical protein